jgi:hypothetical protein
VNWAFFQISEVPFWKAQFTSSQISVSRLTT